MKILYLVGGKGKKYGSERVAFDTITELTKNGIEYVVITSNYGFINEFCDKEKIENHVIPMATYLYLKKDNIIIDGLKRIYRLIENWVVDKKAFRKIENSIDLKKIDIIHTNLSRNLLGGMISEKYNIPHVWHLQELFSGHYGLEQLKRNQTEWMSEHCSKFIAISDTVKNSWIAGGLNEKSIERIYNGCRFSKIIKKTEYSWDYLRLVMVGSICEEKGQLILVEALGQVTKVKREKIILDLYGDGDKSTIEKIKKRAAELAVAVNFKGYSDNIYELLKDYDIAFNCSKGEGFGFNTVEAMAAGLCVVASRTGANPEILPEKAGLLFERNNTAQLADIIEELYDNRDEIEFKGNAAKKIANDCYDFLIYSNNIMKLYNLMLGNRK